MITEHKLNITGDRPFALIGEEIVTESTWSRDATRWWKVSVFTSFRENPEGGWDFIEYVVGIAHITCFKQTERDSFWVVQSGHKKGILKAIKEHVPELVNKVSEQWNAWEERTMMNESSTRSPVEQKPL